MAQIVKYFLPKRIWDAFHLIKLMVRESLDQMTIEDYYEKYPEEKYRDTFAPPQEVAEDGSRWWDVEFS